MALAMQEAKRGACGTTDSHVVPHRSTEVACSGLTSQIGRDTVRFTEYGRRRRIKHARKYERQAREQNRQNRGERECFGLQRDEEG